jgi:4-amino-4-deoxy-L-arabinose transferase-like glycosyltransferase
MATSASRPAWGLRAQALKGARVAIPAGLLALVAVSLLIRTREISIGFWIDEGISQGIANRAVGAIPHALREDGAPPLYYLFLHYWLKLAGDSEAGVRSLSLFFALCAIPVSFWAANAIWRTRRAAWMAAVLAAFDPFMSQYAQEARMYTLIALLAIPALTCFLRAYVLDAGSDGQRRPWIAGFAISLAACLYTHNWAVFLTLALLLSFALMLWLAPRERLLRDGLLGFGGAFVLYLPWIPTTLYQAAHTGAPWSDAPKLSALVGVPATILGRMPQIVLLLCAGAGLVALWQRREELDERVRALIVIVIAAVVTVGLAWVMSQVSPAWASRYYSIAVGPFILLAAGGLANAGRLGLVGLLLVVIMWAQDHAPREKSNVRAVSTVIGPSLAPGDLVISTQPETIPVLAYYLPKGLHYATLTGAVTDTGVWDWRDGVTRLKATTPEKDLQPLIDALPAGRRVVLVQPITYSAHNWRAPWTSLVRLRSKEWDQYLSNVPDLKVTAIQPTQFTPPRPNPVQATVFEKIR